MSLGITAGAGGSFSTVDAFLVAETFATGGVLAGALFHKEHKDIGIHRDGNQRSSKRCFSNR